MTEQQPTIRLLIADDHQIVREGLRTVLSDEPDIALVGEAGDGAMAVTMAAALQPDVVLMDIAMPAAEGIANGIEATRRIRAVAPGVQVIILTGSESDTRVHEALAAGALGYLYKTVSRADLLRAVRAAAQGKPTLDPEAQRALIRGTATPAHSALTEREMQVLRLIAGGKSNKEIGAALHLTEGTVKGYVSIILDKLDVQDRTQAAVYAHKNGLADG